jgi:DNA recombination protein RmuC
MDTTSLLVGVLAGAVAGALAALLLVQRRAAAQREEQRVAHERRLAELDAERSTAREALVRAQAELEASRQQFELWKAESAAARAREDGQRAAQQAEIDKRREQELAALRGEFARLSQEALKLNAEAFNAQATQTFEQRRLAIDGLLAPLKEQLGRLAETTQALETKREGAYEQVRQQVGSLHAATEAVNASSRALIQALRGDTRARGRWGEMALRNVAELSGMTAHCDFDLQLVLDDDKRPDMVVNLPGGDGRIPVDAKAPMDAYMRAMEATDPDARAAALVEHGLALRRHVQALAKKDYAATLGTRVDFTVLFVPSEPTLAAAFEADPGLQADAMERRILLATPVTLLALLRTVALYWRQADLAQNAQLIAQAAGLLHERVRKFTEHLEHLGGALEKTVKHWNAAVGSYELRVLPAGRELEKLQAPSGADKALPDLAAVEESPRELPATPSRELEAG